MNPDEQKIRQLVTTWSEATTRGDIPAVLDLMTDDVVFLVPGQPPMIGKAAFAAAAKAQSPSTPSATRPQIEGTSDIQEIQIHGEWAFMWTKLKVTVTQPGSSTPKVRAGHTLTILKRQQGTWLLARDANLLSSQSA